MTWLKKYWREIFIVVLLITFIVGFRRWKSQREALVRYEATKEQQDQLIKKASDTIETLNQQMLARAAELKQQISAQDKEIAQLKTAIQYSQYIQANLNKVLPTPISVTVPANPQAPAIAQIPQEDLEAITELTANYGKLELKNSACQSDNADLQNKNVVLNDELNATRKERDSVVKAVKGSFWHKTGVALKYLGIGVAIGFGIAHR